MEMNVYFTKLKNKFNQNKNYKVKKLKLCIQVNYFLRHKLKITSKF